MLKITVHENGTHCRLELVGKLGGPWVAETENAWRSSSCLDKEIEVDMRQVTGVDDAGRKLLSALHAAGARFAVKGVELSALVEEITGNQPFKGAKQPRRRKFAGRSTLPDQESIK